MADITKHTMSDFKSGAEVSITVCTFDDQDTHLTISYGDASVNLRRLSTTDLQTIADTIREHLFIQKTAAA